MDLDLDILEILSADRMNVAKEAERAGEKNLGISYQAVKSIKDEWLPKMIERYHFKTSVKIHKHRLPIILPIIEDY